MENHISREYFLRMAVEKDYATLDKLLSIIDKYVALASDPKHRHLPAGPEFVPRDTDFAAPPGRGMN